MGEGENIKSSISKKIFFNVSFMTVIFKFFFYIIKNQCGNIQIKQGNDIYVLSKSK